MAKTKHFEHGKPKEITDKHGRTAQVVGVYEIQSKNCYVRIRYLDNNQVTEVPWEKVKKYLKN